MKPKIQNLLIALAILAGINHVAAQSTVFTYQGRMTDNGTNFNGTGQFKLALVTSTNFNHQATARPILVVFLQIILSAIAPSTVGATVTSPHPP
jgi:hypothetical protein